MNKSNLQAFFLILISTFLSLNIHAQQNIIFDTDIGGDADDLGALAMLHNLADAGECEILAIMCVAADKYAVPAIDAVNHYYNRPDIPIGIRDTVLWEADWRYSRSIAEQLPHDLSSEEAPSAVHLYREILSQQEAKSVKIVTVGYLTNMYNLMRSGPDDISPLTGDELIATKVKEFTIMAGKFPEGEKKFNVRKDPKAAAYVFKNLNVPTVFAGYEVGIKVKTGIGIKQLDKSHPLHIGYDYYYKNAPWEVNATWLNEDEKGKMRSKASFDQTAVLYALRGGVGKYWELVKGGYCHVDSATGDNRWIETDKANQAYLRLIVPPNEIAKVIENIMLGKIE